MANVAPIPDAATTPYSWRRRVLGIVFLGTLPVWYSPLAWWLAMSPYRFVAGVGESAIALDLMLIWVFLGAIAFLAAFPLLICFRAARKTSLHYLAVAILFVPCFLGGFGLGRMVWKQGIDRFVTTSKPLVLAISAYQAKHGRPPELLDDLVPAFLPKIPLTELGSSGDFVYVVGPPARKFANNAWVLHLRAPSQPMGFDRIFYFPNQKYPSIGYGGSIERIGGWGYVHE